MDLLAARHQPNPRGPTFVKGGVAKSDQVIEAFRHRHQGNVLALAGESLVHGDIDVGWLPAAADTYNISADPRDYVLTDVPIVTVDIPNRNMQAFPYEEVAYFDPLYGKFVYSTFNAKPTHIDHENKDPLKAKGVIFDAALQFVPAYDVWKIRILAGWDRTKDPWLVDQILRKKRTGYSMGALVENFVPLAAGTRVDTEHGLVPIESVRPGTQVMTVHGLRASGGSVFNGYLPIVQLKTKAGMSLSPAPNHPLLVLRPDLSTAWVEAGDVAVGDHIAVRSAATPADQWPKRLAFEYVPIDAEVGDDGTAECEICHEKFGHIGNHVRATHRMSTAEYRERFHRRVLNPKNLKRHRYPGEMTADLAAVLGYFIAEGSWGVDGALVGFVNEKETLNQHFTDCYERCFGAVPAKTSTPLGVQDFFEHIGVTQGYARDKRIPWSIMTGPRDAAISFLRAFWEGDGSARSIANAVSFHTTSQGLAQDIQVLLLKFGIPSQLIETEGYTTKQDPEVHAPLKMHNVALWGHHIDTFVHEIGATSPERKADLENLITARNTTQYGEVIPFLRETLDRLYGRRIDDYSRYETTAGIERLSLRRLELKDNSNIAYGHLERWPDLVDNIRKIDPELGERIAGLLDSRLCWTPVTNKDITQVMVPMYCIADVREGHNFIAEGYVVHNCSACGAVDTNVRKCACMQRGKGSITSENRLIFQVCCGVNFIENSSVEDPADITADTDAIWE